MKSHSFFLCQKERMYLDELGEKKKKKLKKGRLTKILFLFQTVETVNVCRNVQGGKKILNLF